MHADETTSNRRFTVKEAAQRLNVSEAAIRQRIQRDTITYEKDEETNRVFILLDEEGDRLGGVEPEVHHEVHHDNTRELIDTLREQLRLEREASAELRRIVAGLTARIPAIEAPPEPRESPLSAPEEPPGTQAPPEPEKPGSWWRKVLFGQR